jgi:hypothetical protein
MCGFLLGRNAQLLHFSWGESRRCCISAGKKIRICLIYPRAKSTSDINFVDFSQGEIRHMQIIPGRNSGHVAFLPGRNLHLSDFSRGDISTCHISPGEKFIFLSDVSPGYTNFQICALCTWHHTSNMEQIIH